jgi:hypothetical protein
MALPEEELRDPDRIGGPRKDVDTVVSIGWGTEWHDSRSDPVAPTIEFAEKGTPASITAPTAREAAREAQDPDPGLDPSTEKVPAKAKRRGIKALVGSAVVGLIATGGVLGSGQDEGDGKVTAPNRPVAGATPFSAENDQEVSVGVPITAETSVEPPTPSEVLDPKILGIFEAWGEEAVVVNTFDKKRNLAGVVQRVVMSYAEKLHAKSRGVNERTYEQLLPGITLLLENSSTGKVTEVSNPRVYGLRQSETGGWAFGERANSQNYDYTSYVLVYEDDRGLPQGIALFEDGTVGWSTINPSTTQLAGVVLDEASTGRPMIEDGRVDPRSITGDGSFRILTPNNGMHTSFEIERAKAHPNLEAAFEDIMNRPGNKFVKPIGLRSFIKEVA